VSRRSDGVKGGRLKTEGKTGEACFSTSAFSLPPSASLVLQLPLIGHHANWMISLVMKGMQSVPSNIISKGVGYGRGKIRIGY
jgi:hypothetical protein